MECIYRNSLPDNFLTKVHKRCEKKAVKKPKTTEKDIFSGIPGERKQKGTDPYEKLRRKPVLKNRKYFKNLKKVKASNHKPAPKGLHGEKV